MLKFTKCLILDNIALALFSLVATLFIWWCYLIPKCFTESVGKCRVPFNLRFKSESIFFVSDLKRTTSVLPKLRKSLFASSQLFKFFKS